MKKRIAITGSTTGMGAALAEELHASGHDIIGLDIVPPREPVFPFVQVDLASQSSIEQAAGSVGNIDALVHCAGIPDNDAPADTVLAVNFLGLRALTDLVLPSLADGGTIVSISSIAGHRFRDRLDEYARLLQTTSIDEGLAWLRTAPEAITGRAIYTVSKEAVWAYTMALAAQLAPRRIRVNSVAPGLVDTRLVGAFLSNMTASGKTVLQSASGGPIDPHEVTAVMRFLLSEDARRVNGQNIVVDGGFLASAEAPTWDGALSAAGAR